MRTTAIALLIILAGCAKDDDSEPSVQAAWTPPVLDRMVEVQECSQNTHKDVYIGSQECSPPELTYAGQTVTIAMWGDPQDVNGVTTWAPACVQLKVSGQVVATFYATAPEQFTYVIQ